MKIKKALNTPLDAYQQYLEWLSMGIGALVIIPTIPFALLGWLIDKYL